MKTIFNVETLSEWLACQIVSLEHFRSSFSISPQKFEEMTKEIDLFETAVAEYDEVILQLLFPNPREGFPKFQLLKTDISLAEPTIYIRNGEGDTDLTAQEVVFLLNSYIQDAETAYKRKRERPG